MKVIQTRDIFPAIFSHFTKEDNIEKCFYEIIITIKDD